ncbi:hypothetical protein P7C70_g1434, partial [Phenoliferia sp. Uapishka_3]
MSRRPSQTSRPRAGPKEKGKEKAPSSALNLSNTVITIPPTLTPAAYPGLHKLDLTNCGLTSLSFVKDAAATLTWLNVSGNKLDGPTAWDGVEELKGLFVLNASNCGLTRVPSAVASLTSLKALVLSHNNLKSLGPHISRLQDLNSLIVSHNVLTTLPLSLTTLPSLKKISASHNLLVSSKSFPDLSSLSHLREIRLSSNPTLNELPDHFANWGKGKDETGKEGRGLEILDLGGTGFEDWTGLKALVGQKNLVNLGVKGTKVSEEAMEEGFEAFRDKITILLPSLRILNDVRFDAKFHDLKARRDARAPEVRVLDAGPMGLAINEKSEKPVEIPVEMIAERDKRKKRRAEGRLRAAARAAGLGDADGNVVMEVEETGAEHSASTDKDESKSKKRKSAAGKAEEVDATAEPKAKKSKRSKSEVVDEASTSTTDAQVEESSKKSKRKKNRHAPRTAAEIEAEAVAEATDSASTSVVLPSTSTATPSQPESTEPVVKPLRKRGRESKYLGTVRTPETRPPPRPKGVAAIPTAPTKPIKRNKRTPGGLLAELRGDGTEVEEVVKKPQEKVVEKAAEKEEEKKAKTSVLKVVEVKKKESSGGGMDLASLLGWAKKEDRLGTGGGWN